ncbi:hypothetical protein [Streptomyces sp. A5-4]|uniref:hypothetical protein n=1 Tax=Streptomyces sp. A5-4 TaxID=3384771 RepID=UPI003DA85A26
MNRRDHAIARAAARYFAQWLSGIAAVGALALLGAVVVVNGPETFIFFLKRGSLAPVVAIFAVATLAWLLLPLAGARDRRREAA